MKDLKFDFSTIPQLLRMAGKSHPFRRWATRLAVVLIQLVILGACRPAKSPIPTAPVATPSRTAVRLGPTSTFPPTFTPAPSSPPTPTLVPLQPISDDDWSRGPRDAEVTLVVYSDFQ